MGNQSIMAAIMNSSTGKKGTRTLQIDMTPMVDLGFLLITFFIFTTTIESPQTLKLLLPVDGPSTPIPQTKSLTILLSESDRAICYIGMPGDEALLHANMQPGSTELRDIILAKQAELRETTGTADGLTVIIKPGKESNYRQLIAVLDEMAICEVKKHVVATMDNDDQLLAYSQ